MAGVATALIAAFIAGFALQGSLESQPKNFFLEPVGLEVFCEDGRMEIYVYVENTGNRQFTSQDIEADGYKIRLTGDGVEDRVIESLLAQLGGIEPGEQGYMIVYVGTYREAYESYSKLILESEGFRDWQTGLDLSKGNCLFNS